jgi:hypothetical protein
MLNGSTVKATDKSFYSNQPLDDISQVKVFVENESKINYTTKETYKKFWKVKKETLKRIFLRSMAYPVTR